MKARLLFAGTPEFAVPSLHAAFEHGQVLAVLSQPDRPAGRGRKAQVSPVKQAALDYGLPVLQPQSLRDAAVQAELASLKPDLMIVVAYGLILPQAVLDIPRFGAWNVHASLLPRWRGAAPIQRAIEAGDAQTGVCLMQMQKGLDTGPVLLRRSTPLGEEETAGHLHDRLAVIGAQVLASGLQQLQAGTMPSPEPQATQGIVYAHKLDKAEARLDWSQPASVLERKVRAFNPWPVAEAMLEGERVRIHAARAIQAHGRVGEVIGSAREGIDVACGEGALRLLTVQRDGGRAMAAIDYLNARPTLRR